MFFSRHQLNRALQALEEAQRTSPCTMPRRTDVQERWNDAGEFEYGPVPEPTYLTKEVGHGTDRRHERVERDGVPVRTNADLLPDPHGRAFLYIDPETFEVKCAACEEGGQR